MKLEDIEKKFLSESEILERDKQLLEEKRENERRRIEYVRRFYYSDLNGGGIVAVLHWYDDNGFWVDSQNWNDN